MTITNQQMSQHRFLSDMQGSSYYPAALVERGQGILRDLCAQIEARQPHDLDALYLLTHAATDRFSELADALFEQGSEIDTVARENIVADMLVIARAYGFENADAEALTEPRDW